MANITGTAGADSILRHSLSAGVVTDPPVAGTDNGDFNTIRAYGGNDLIEASDVGAAVFGGGGSDWIFGGLGYDNLMATPVWTPSLPARDRCTEASG